MFIASDWIPGAATMTFSGVRASITLMFGLSVVATASSASRLVFSASLDESASISGGISSSIGSWEPRRGVFCQNFWDFTAFFCCCGGGWYAFVYQRMNK